MTHRLHAIVHGQVQGVSFRYYTISTAHKLDLTGWVRNLPDGTVEAVAEGEKTALYELLDFLRTGSPAAQVTKVQVTWPEATSEFDDFAARYGYLYNAS